MEEAGLILYMELDPFREEPSGDQLHHWRDPAKV